MLIVGVPLIVEYIHDFLTGNWRHVEAYFYIRFCIPDMLWNFSYNEIELNLQAKCVFSEKDIQKIAERQSCRVNFQETNGHYNFSMG